MVRKQSEKVSAIEWEEIKVCEHPGQLEKIKDKVFDDFRNRVTKQSVGRTVFSDPSGFVYFVRCPHENFMDNIRSKNKGTVNIIYSQWAGYLLEEHKTYCTDYLNRLKNDSSISFQVIHTSGHATVPDLMKFAKAINPKRIVPIHTAYPETFKKEFEKEGFENIYLWEDGVEYQL